MSVCMSLYKVNSNVVYKGHYMDFVSWEDCLPDKNGVRKVDSIEEELGCPTNPFELFDWMDKQEELAWSDSTKHTFFDISYYKKLFRNSRSWHRMEKRLSKFEYRIFDNKKEKKKYLTVDKIKYAQGWFFNKRFYKKKVTVVFCTTKRELENFFKQYVKCKTVEERKIINNFLNSWEDGMLFECSW